MSEGKEVDACGVCERTILPGERVAEYATPAGAQVGVCTLCKPAAEAAGWVPAALAGTLDHGAGTRQRGLGLRARLARASAAARGRRGRPAHEPERVGQGGHARPTQQAERGTGEAPPRRAEGGRQLRRGVEHFNASGEPQKIAGLIRTLGEPRVAVRANSGGAVMVTIAWELSWYQWEVSAEPNGEGVRETGKGSEVSELALHDRSWNASAAGDGKVTLELAAARRATPEP